MSFPKVSIIISNWNGVHDTVECLESLRKIDYPNYVITVVDNGSKCDEAKALIERFGNYIYVIENDKNYGYAAGANIGIKYALSNDHPDYCMVLNNDTKVDRLFLSELVKAAENDKFIGVVGPKVYHYDEPNLIQTIGGKLNINTGTLNEHMAEVDRGQHDETKEVDWHGPCLVVKSEVIKKIGLYDDDYFVFWEDVDFCFRVRKAGYRIIYVPSSRIWHKGGRSTGRLNGLYYPIRNRFLFMRKHATKLQYFSFLAYFFCYDIWYRFFSLVSKYRWDFSKVRAVYSGIKDGASDSKSAEKNYRR